MPRMNIEGYLVSLLSERLDAEVRPTVPDPRPRRLVTVERAGGSAHPDIRDRAGVHLTCWGPTKAEAYALAESAAEIVRALPRERFLDGVARVDEESFRFDPDPESGQPRYFISYTFTTFRY